MKENEFNEWYKKSFEQLREEPPADVWNSIQGELDVQDVWTRVDKKLTFFNKRATVLKWSSGIAAALLIAAGVSFLDNDAASSDPVAQRAHRHEYVPSGDAGERNSISVAANNSDVKPLQASNENRSNSSGSNNVPTNKKKKNGSSSKQYASNSSNNSSRSSLNGSSGIPGADDNLALTVQSASGTQLEFQKLLRLFLTENSADNSLASSFDPSVSPDSLIGSKTLSGIGIGGTSAFNNTWIMNPTTFAGLKTKALYRSRVSMGSAYGLNGSYDLNTFWGVEASLMSSTQRQVYSYFNRAGEYKEKDNKLEYYQVSILIKRKKPVFCGGAYKGIMRTISAGPTARYLHTATDETNGSEKGASYQYSKGDYGITIDYGYDIPVRKRIMLSPGITAYAGAKDISRGRLVEPSHFNRTHNASIGLRMSARYIFSQR